MKDYIRELIACTFDISAFENAVAEIISARIDYDELAGKILDTIPDEEIEEIALDIILNA